MAVLSETNVEFSFLSIIFNFLFSIFLLPFQQAGFLEGVTNIVPALGGVNLKEMLDDAAYEPGGKLLLDFNDRIGDRIQVFLE
ncbi:hypothetical protein TIFTF001_028763 [Ficus carica]|uniref:Uncharacterized protein n=1 Tax=Ficus carica TaxID=3494 RepID=A0AA88DQI1_FICCA|nr:hypothetical protein TIFTF001_028763 [Ficus carica]